MSRYISYNEFWDNINKCFLPNSPRGKNTIKFDNKYGNIKLNYFSTGRGMTYSSFIASFSEDTILEGINEDNYSFLSFNTGSCMQMKEHNKKDKIQLDSNLCLNGFQNKGLRSNGLYGKNKQYISHHITFENELFDSFVPKCDKIQSPLTLFKSDHMQLNFNNKITSHQKILLNDLAQISNVNDKLQELYLESKLLDLVYTSFNCKESQQKENCFRLSQKDIECLHKAKSILIENMNNPPSLKELSYKAAINEFKLKKGFKQLFGNTVYGFLQVHRLNEAKKLLETNEINIGEASFLVGYKSISHFSKIFKDHFGFTPIQIKKESRSIYY